MYIHLVAEFFPTILIDKSLDSLAPRAASVQQFELLMQPASHSSVRFIWFAIRFVSAVTTTPIPTPTSISTATTPLETQSTVIISFKSSQTPASSQRPVTPPDSSAAGEGGQHVDEARQLDADASTLVPPPPGYGTPTNPLLSSNVLKKVASFSVERSSSTGSSCNSNCAPNAQSPALAMAAPAPSGDERETTLTATQLEQSQSQQSVAAGAGSRRGSSFVPEKLSFAAYEKFEGKSSKIYIYPLPQRLFYTTQAQPD